MFKRYWFIVSGLCCSLMLSAQLHLPLRIMNGQTQELSTGLMLRAHSAHNPISVPAVEGEGMRTDGYSTYLLCPIDSVLPSNDTVRPTYRHFTASVWFAAETWPVMTPLTADPNNPLYTAVMGNIDDSAHTGFVFELSNMGAYRFRCYSDGWHVVCDGDGLLRTGEWIHLTACVDGTNQRARLYRNGQRICDTRCMTNLSIGQKPLLIGKCEKDTTDGIFPLNYFCGIIDEVRLDTFKWSATALTAHTQPAAPNMDIPISAYKDDLFRPRYHGLPAQGWTNETHGLTYSNGRWHLFFQKNANGPYMTRLHWGHLSSPDLCHWREERIALAPSESYDNKGCWSGCIVRDEITGWQPWALYSAINDSHCELMFATPNDADLNYWTKTGTPGIRCSFRDDFRDPYFFRANGRPYIIAGCADGGTGIATLQRYEGDNWTSDGDIFFRANPTLDPGNFWEMPTITPMGDGQWLFTTTPMATSHGVRVLYWIGTIDGAGHFHPNEDAPQTMELPGLAKDGYGLLSPTICQQDGKTIALGIVPDKVSSKLNYDLGWAHLYSFPRELSLDANHQLVQRPYSGLTVLRTDTSVSRRDFMLSGTMDLSPIMGRSVELRTSFVLGDAEVGLELLKNNYGSMKIYIDTATYQLVVDMTTIGRKANDYGLFDGLYKSDIPGGLSRGQICTIHAFFDHSILDVFINDRYASSIRLYPYDWSANGCAIYSKGGDAYINSVEAWGLGQITHYAPSTPKTQDTETITDHSQQTQKIMRDGQVYIFREGKVYSILGDRIR